MSTLNGTVFHVYSRPLSQRSDGGLVEGIADCSRLSTVNQKWVYQTDSVSVPRGSFDIDHKCSRPTCMVHGTLPGTNVTDH